MNTTSCSAGRLDAETEPRLSFVNIHRLPEAEAEFLKSLTHESTNDNNERPRSSLHESYASRQRYIRSYPFCCKEPFLRRTSKKMKIKMRKVGALSFSCFNAVFKFITSMRCSRSVNGKGGWTLCDLDRIIDLFRYRSDLSLFVFPIATDFSVCFITIVLVWLW